MFSYRHHTIAFVEVGHGLSQQHKVLTALYAAHVEYIFIWQVVTLSHFFFLIARYGVLKRIVAALVHHVYLIGIDVIELNDIALGTLAHRYDTVGLYAGFLELIVVDGAVYKRIAFGVAKEYQIVYGNYVLGTSAYPAYIERKLVAESVVYIESVFLYVGRYSPHPPQRAELTPYAFCRVCLFEGTLYRSQQLFFPFIGDV